MLLRVVAEPQAVAGDDLAGVRLVDPGEDPQQGGLAGAVEAEDDDPEPRSIARSTSVKISSEP